MFKGCYTALVTPMKEENGLKIDYNKLQQLVGFQIEEGISGILAMGTTGESPTLDWEEHSKVIEKVKEFCHDKCTTIAGTGSNSTSEAMRSTEHAVDIGADAALLVEPYYNGPSSIEIRREYISPIAKAFPEMPFIPYVIPGRSGTQLLPEDLAILCKDFDNINSVKEASGSLENMRRSRECAGEDLEILSGDDDLTYTMLTDADIAASGAISVMSNIAPGPMQKMIAAVLDRDMASAEKWYNALKPLLEIVTVKTEEPSPWGPRLCKSRNPVPVKTLMNLLGMNAGPPRQPLGKMTRDGIEVVRKAALDIQGNTPELFAPIADFFEVDIEGRLNDKALIDSLCY